MIVFYHQVKIQIGFICRRQLNPKSLIQEQITLPIEIIVTHEK